MTTHTEGPWFADARGRIWRRPPSDLYENGGGVAGDKPIAVVSVGWAGEGVTGYPVEDNARLIAAAPEMLLALQTIARKTLHRGTAMLHEEEMILVTQAIARATGERK